MIDHMLLHYSKERILLQLVFSLFGAPECPKFAPIYKRKFPSWHKSFMGKKEKKSFEICTSVHVLNVWKQRNKNVFEEAEWSKQAAKSNFMSFLLD